MRVVQVATCTGGRAGQNCGGARRPYTRYEENTGETEGSLEVNRHESRERGIESTED